MKQSIIREFLRCPACRKGDLETVPFESESGAIRNGIAACRSCPAWYRIEDWILELLVPSLRDQPAVERFRARFGSRWDGWRNGRDESPKAAPASADDEHKLGQKSFYDEDALAYETQMLQLCFWKALDLKCQALIRRGVGSRATMVEIGGGIGRISLPLSGSFKTILSFDISEAMVRTAVRKRESHGRSAENIHYFVADAENIPIGTERVDAAVMYGILHHLGSPAVCVREMARVLKPGGFFFALENNRSAFRAIFDLSMRVKKLWNEKAHEEHFIISHRELSQWFAETGLRPQISTSVFLPPHLLSRLSLAAAGRMLRRTDAFAGMVPWLKYQGGLILCSGTK
jgi:ubiquinone/menaquinone biosynthesis C-methylase UbiE/uncharacterized protein YbaR (Trm112 family)